MSSDSEVTPTPEVDTAKSTKTRAMTLAFETFMGRVLGGKPWPQVFEDYDVLAGRIWILVPLFTFIGPYVFFRATARRGRPR